MRTTVQFSKVIDKGAAKAELRFAKLPQLLQLQPPHFRQDHREQEYAVMPSTVMLVLQSVLEEYALPVDGIHGVVHWARVMENGLFLAKTTGANIEVVKLFAVLHDSRRLNDGHDPDHGPRAAQLAHQIRGRLIDLPDHEFGLLWKACEGHTHERTHPDITVQTCWDSDRLDLGRVGITPHPTRLCTDVAKLAKTIEWAEQRAVTDYLPSFVKDEWKIVFPAEKNRHNPQ